MTRPPRRKPGPKKRTPEERLATRRPRVPKALRDVDALTKAGPAAETRGTLAALVVAPPTPQDTPAEKAAKLLPLGSPKAPRALRRENIMADIGAMLGEARPVCEIVAVVGVAYDIEGRTVRGYIGDVLASWAEAARQHQDGFRARAIGRIHRGIQRAFAEGNLEAAARFEALLSHITGLDQPTPAPAPVLSTAEADARAAILIPRIRQILAERAGATVDVTPRATMDPCPTPPHK